MPKSWRSVVQLANRKREKIKEELEPIVAELQDRRSKANAILEKYYESS